MNASWMIPFIVLGGALQTCGAAMNSQLYKHMINPWLASAISAAVVAISLSQFLSLGRNRCLAHRTPVRCRGGLLSGVSSEPSRCMRV